jgi:outer membrane lipoprotein SlyB
MRNLLVSFLLAVPLAALGAPMTNDDVIKMVTGGLGEATVIQAIDAAEPAFDTSPDGLVKLKQGGVSDAVIQRIIARRSAAPAAAPAAASAATAPARAAPACPACGTVTGIREIEQPRKVGAGTATGALIGGVLGYAIGGHSNRTAGTVIGATGGAVAGNVYENRAAAGRTFEIGVQFDDGSSRSYQMDSHPSWRQGSRVKLVNGALSPL